MKKIVLAFTFCALALSANSSLKGSILVNTVSFADLPDQPANNQGSLVTNQNIQLSSPPCAVKVKTTVTTSKSCQVIPACEASDKGN